MKLCLVVQIFAFISFAIAKQITGTWFLTYGYQNGLLANALVDTSLLIYTANSDDSMVSSCNGTCIQHINPMDSSRLTVNVQVDDVWYGTYDLPIIPFSSKKVIKSLGTTITMTHLANGIFTLDNAHKLASNSCILGYNETLLYNGPEGACCTYESDCDGRCINGVCSYEPYSVDIEPMYCLITTTSAESTTAAPTPTSGGGSGNGGNTPPPLPCFLCWLGLGAGDGPDGVKCSSSDDCKNGCIKNTCGGIILPYPTTTTTTPNINVTVTTTTIHTTVPVTTTTTHTIVPVTTTTTNTNVPVTTTTTHTTVPVTTTTTNTNVPVTTTTTHTTVPVTTTTTNTNVPVTTTTTHTTVPVTTTTTNTNVPVTTTTTHTTVPVTTTTPSPCISGYCGKGTGNGPNGVCCSSNKDCKDTCNSDGKCGLSDESGPPKFGCDNGNTPSCIVGYCGKHNGGGGTGACCSNNDDCQDTCNSNGKCGVSDETGPPKNPTC